MKDEKKVRMLLVSYTNHPVQDDSWVCCLHLPDSVRRKDEVLDWCKNNQNIDICDALWIYEGKSFEDEDENLLFDPFQYADQIRCPDSGRQDFKDFLFEILPKSVSI